MRRANYAVFGLICLGLAAAAPAETSLVPVLAPGTPMPDGNGRARTVSILTQLPDGRLVLGMNISQATSRVTGFPVQNSYGVFDYDPLTQQLTTEFRHDYPLNQGGAPNQVKGWHDEEMDIPYVLDNGDRTYGYQDASYSYILRYSDTYGLVHYPNGDRASQFVKAGIGGGMATTILNPTSPSWTIWDLPDHGGARPLLKEGDTIPGNPGKRLVWYPSVTFGAPDGSWFLSGQFYEGGNYFVRAKAGQPMDLLKDASGQTAVYGGRPAAIGEKAVAYFSNVGLSVQDDYGQPVRPLYQKEQAIRADGRVWHGGGEFVSSWRDQGFLAKLPVNDPSAQKFLGNGFALFSKDGQMRNSVLPGDANPYGAGKILDVRKATNEYGYGMHGPDTAMAFEVRFTDLPAGNTADTAFWRMGMDGALSLELQEGQMLPGMAQPMYYARLLGMTVDGGTMYQIFTGGQTERVAALATYKPSIGLHIDLRAQDDPGHSYGWSSASFLDGPKGMRILSTDGSLWRASDVGPAELLHITGQKVRGEAFTIQSFSDLGFTDDERFVFQANLIGAAQGTGTAKALYMLDGTSLVELLDFGTVIDGKRIESARFLFKPGTSWVYTAPGDLPILQLTFDDGTSGLYTVPEPASLAMLLAGGALAAVKRQRA